jgi:hypothetical protein
VWHGRCMSALEAFCVHACRRSCDYRTMENVNTGKSTEVIFFKVSNQATAAGADAIVTESHKFDLTI